MAKSKKKIFVLDTSVIIFNHTAIFKFEEHDVAIPLPVLEELDGLKKGSENRNYEAREFIRTLDKISAEKDLTDWIPLGEGLGRIKVLLYTNGLKMDATKEYGEVTMDNKILNTALSAQKENPDNQIIFVTKDVNLRLKAKGLRLSAEDFEYGKVQNVDSLPTGVQQIQNLPQSYLDLIHKNHYVDKSELPDIDWKTNNYYILQSEKGSALAYYNGAEERVEKVEKRICFGVKPRNAEQAFAMHALLNPKIQLVAIKGVAGTGKTLLALASALEQRREFKQIYLARPIVPLSNRDIGYLPGDIASKIDPYMQPLWDNLKFIQNQWDEKDKEYKQIQQMIETEKLMITPLAYIRGRSLSDVIFIVDEAQNLTPHEVKTIITRAGENTKFIFTGDTKQIDTPYLDEQSNGLSHLIDGFQNQDLFSYIRLEKGERSSLANLANELL